MTKRPTVHAGSCFTTKTRCIRPMLLSGMYGWLVHWFGRL